MTVIAGLALVVCFAAAAGYGLLGESRDYQSYLSEFNSLTPYYTGAHSRFETGYELATWVCKIWLGLNFQQTYVLLAAFALALKFRLFCKYADAPVFATIIYLMMLYPLHEYTQIRAAVGIAIGYTAVDFYLERRYLPALIAIGVACTFHSSTAALIGGFFLVDAVSRLRPIIGISTLIAASFPAALLISKIVAVLAAFFRIVMLYLEAQGMFAAPTVASLQNVLLVCVLIASAIFLRPWQRRTDYLFYLLAILGFVAFLSLISVPIFSRRISELFLFPFLLFTFRFDETHQSRIPAATLALAALWMLYKTFQLGMMSI